MENINAGPEDGDEALPDVRAHLERGHRYDDDGNDGCVCR